jgi:hypothetical protein
MKGVFGKMDKAQAFDYLLSQFSEMVDSVETNQLSTYSFNDAENQLFMLGYKRCLRDVLQRVREVLDISEISMSDYDFKFLNPDEIVT